MFLIRLVAKLRATPLTSNASAYLFGTILNRIFPLLLTPLYTRTMSPTEFGTWGFCVTILAVLITIADLGLESATTRLFFDHAGEDRKNFLLVGFLLRMVAAVAVMAVLAGPLFLSWHWLTGGSIARMPFVPLLIACAIVQAMVSYNLIVARAAGQASLFVRVQVTQTAAQGALSVAFVFAGWGAAGPFWGYLLGAAAVGGFVGWRFVRANRVDDSLNFTSVRKSLRYGIATLPTNLAIWMRRMADRVVIGRSVSLASLATYQLAASSIAPVNIIMSSFNSAYQPFFYQKRKSQGAACLQLIAAIDRVAVAGLAILTIGCIALAPELIRVMAPPAYGEASRYAPFLLLTAFFGGVSAQFNKELLFHKKPALVSAITVIPATAAVLFNVVFVPHLGAIFAAWSSAIASALMALMSMITSHRIEGGGKSLLGVIGASVVVSLFGFACAEILPRVPFAASSLTERLAAAIISTAAVGAILLPPSIAFFRGRKKATA